MASDTLKLPDLEVYFPGRDELKDYMKAYLWKFSHRHKIVQNSWNYYHCKCYNESCSFSIKFTLKKKSTEFPLPEKGLFLHKNSKILHSTGCKYDPSRSHYSDTPQSMANLIIPLYENDPKVTKDTISHFLQCLFRDDEISEARLKYICSLAKHSIRGHRSQFIEKIVEIVRGLESHEWKISITYETGFLSSIVIIPPWSANLIHHFPSPLITDATFTCDKLSFYTLRIIDGECSLHTVVLVIRAFEDYKGYVEMFQFARENILQEQHVTLISDLGKPIKKSLFSNI
jgi:hypothetical protein